MMIKDSRQAKFGTAVFVLQDYKARLDKENTVKGIDQPKRTSRRCFQIKFNVSYVKQYINALEIDYIKHYRQII